MARAWRILRKVLLWFFGTLIALVLLLIGLAYVFEDEIHLYVIKELGRRLNARIDVEKTHLSFLRSFPQVNIRLEGLTINPLDREEDFDFIRVEDASFYVDFWSFFSDSYKVSGLQLEKPEVKIHRYRDGAWSFGSVFQIPEDTTGAQPVDTGRTELALRKVKVYEGYLDYVDELGGDVVRIKNLNSSLSGDLSADSTEVESLLDFELDQWRSGGMPMLGKRQIKSDLVFQACFGDREKYILDRGKLFVNRLELDLTGKMDTYEDRYRLDLGFKTSKGTFEEFMSLLPGGFLDAGKDYDYRGDFKMAGWVKGLIGEGRAPDFFADYVVEKGYFKYADVESALNEVNLKGAFLYKSQQPAMSYLKVDTLTAKLNELPLTGNLALTDFSKPLLGMTLNGNLGLKDIRDFYPQFSDKTQMDGRVDVAVKIQGLIEDFQKLNVAAISASGSLAMDGVKLYNEYMPKPLEDLSARAIVDNSRILLNQFQGRAGKSSFALTGTITNYLSYLLDSTGVLRARLALQSPLIDLNDWLGEAPKETAASTAPVTYQYALPRRIDFVMDASIGQFALGKFEASTLSGAIRMNDDTLAIRNLGLNALGGSMNLEGTIGLKSDHQLDLNLHPVFSNVDMGRTFRAFDQMAAFALVKENLSGVFSGDMILRGSVDESMTLNEKTFFSEGEVSIHNGRLVNFEPLEAMAGFVRLDDLKDIQFSDVSTHFIIQDGYFNVPWMKILANEYKLEVTGRHGFDNSLDYRVRIELPKKAAKRSTKKEILDLVEEEAAEPEARMVIPLRVTGTVENPKFALDGEFVKGAIRDKIENQVVELREGFQKEVEVMFGEQDTNEVEDMVIVEPGDPKRPIWPIKPKQDSTPKKPGKPLDKIQNPFLKKTP